VALLHIIKGNHPTAASVLRLKKQEARKEVKALKAAQIEKSLEKELLSRLSEGTYGDIYNFPSMQYNKVLDKAAIPDGEEEVDVFESTKQQVAADASCDEDLQLDYNSDEVFFSLFSSFFAFNSHTTAFLSASQQRQNVRLAEGG
jgi:hypothetical protein